MQGDKAVIAAAPAMKNLSKVYGTELTDTELIDMSQNLLGFFDLLLKIDQRRKAEWENKANGK